VFSSPEKNHWDVRRRLLKGSHLIEERSLSLPSKERFEHPPHLMVQIVVGRLEENPLQDAQLSFDRMGERCEHPILVEINCVADLLIEDVLEPIPLGVPGAPQGPDEH
jgi:hypothetical protein